MPLADDDIGAKLRRRFEQSERQRVHNHAEERTGCLGRLTDGAEILNAAQEIRVLNRHDQRVIVNHRRQLFGAGVQIITYDLRAHPLHVCVNHLPVLRVDGR